MTEIESVAPRSCTNNRDDEYYGQDWLSVKETKQWLCWFWENIDVWEDEVSLWYNGKHWVLKIVLWFVLSLEDCVNKPTEHEKASFSSSVLYEQSCSLVNICDPCKRCRQLVMVAYIEIGGTKHCKNNSNKMAKEFKLFFRKNKLEEDVNCAIGQW